MEGRLWIPTWITATCLLLGVCGCQNRSQSIFSTSNQNPGPGMAKMPAAPSGATHVPVSAQVETGPPDDGKRVPRVAVAMAAYKEADARAMDRNPETQFKVRDQARKLYQEAIRLDPNFVEAHRGLARVYVDLGDFPRAQDTLHKAQAKFPKHSIFWYEQAQLHNRKKEFPAAIGALNRALEMDPENRTYITTLGMTLARTGHTDQAVQALSRSMGPASANYNVARMLIHLNRPTEAQHHLRVAVQQNPNLEAARQMLSQMENGVQPAAGLEIDA
jgi:tetratricopeptide (TPR) repeat protein